MKVYFVMDLMDGKVVKAIRGERERYLPVNLCINAESNPLKLIEKIQPRYLYVADLDRIMDRGDNCRIINLLSEKVDHLIADCGFKEPDEIKNLKFDAIVGSETFNLRELEDISESEVRYVSIDIKDCFLDASKSFDDWREALLYLNSFDMDGVIILNLLRVGTMSLDINTFREALDISDNPLFAGGGIRSLDDIFKLKDMGYQGVLVASSVYIGEVPLSILRNGTV
ncbi:MAG TPA: HisA/HisF family protein [Archaeoglobaceae archaeon]|nr:HisA/HisF family protein [Archaeoglobaceae archaeon]